jgi:serine/threonine-protein kinase HipA
VSKELIALMDGQKMGRVLQVENGKLSFVYDESWRASEKGYPLSLSMPLALTEHPHEKIDIFLWGLLPDNERVLDRWAREHQVSARNSFGLIAAVGEDCAGAVQFVRPERLENERGAAPGQVAWLDEKEIAERLRTLRRDHAAGRLPRDAGQFSLAGAQPKTAFLFENGRWGIPSGRAPTTRILKPPTGEFDGHAENEHFCLELARALGLTVPNSQILHFEDEIAIVIDRYDRVRIGDSWHRLHQEDLCQALSVPPTRKYENEGGPGAREIVELLRDNSSTPTEDVETFLDAIAFNWLIAGTDAHAKNYSVLIGAQGNVRLAPLYDLASVLPYPDVDLERAKLAMNIGKEYRLRNINLFRWKKMASELRVDAEGLLKRIESFALALPDLAEKTRQKLVGEGLTHTVLARLAEEITRHATRCRNVLNAGERGVK